MRIITLCREGSCCPVVTIEDNCVRIGEGEKTCTLTMEQWQTLKDKILAKEV